MTQSISNKISHSLKHFREKHSKIVNSRKTPKKKKDKTKKRNLPLHLIEKTSEFSSSNCPSNLRSSEPYSTTTPPPPSPSPQPKKKKMGTSKLPF